MKDLLVITPSRGRPQSMMRLAMAIRMTAQAQTKLVFALDDDDETARLDGPWRDFADWARGPRDSLAGWTNRMAVSQVGEFRAFASLGDDHIPWTPGWDRLLLDAVDAMGGTGIAYGNDCIQGAALPTAVVISVDIVAALGWMCEPSLAHFYVDNVWKDLGEGAGCLAYVPQVVIEHWHPSVGKGLWDAVSTEYHARQSADAAAYKMWRKERMDGDVATVRALRAAS